MSEWFRVQVKTGIRVKVYAVPAGSEKNALDKVKQWIREGRIR